MVCKKSFTGTVQFPLRELRIYSTEFSFLKYWYFCVLYSKTLGLVQQRTNLVSVYLWSTASHIVSLLLTVLLDVVFLASLSLLWPEKDRFYILCSTYLEQIEAYAEARWCERSGTIQETDEKLINREYKSFYLSPVEYCLCHFYYRTWTWCFFEFCIN